MNILNQKLIFSSKYYQTILDYLTPHAHSSRLIGGCVRDALISKQNNDIDIATTLLPNEVITILSNKEFKVIPTGLKFGTVTAFIENERFEITTLRKDLECYGRDVKVEFTTSFEEDALRRDFTINALSYTLDKIYDYFNGIEDLKNQRVVFIGNPYDRIKEDYLRILRFFRFSCYYANALDNSGLDACVALRSGINLLSRERIKLEMDKLIAATTAPTILSEMYKAGILQMIFPIKHFNEAYLQSAISFIKPWKVNLNYLTLYSILFYESNFDSQDLLNLKFSKSEAQIILSTIKFINEISSSNIDFLLKKIWLNQLDYLDYLSVAVGVRKIDEKIATDFINNNHTKIRPVFPVTGYDLLSIGFCGKNLGETLLSLQNLWIKSNFTLTKEELCQEANRLHKLNT